MRYGRFLNGGGTIGFVAPSFGCATGYYRPAFDAAKENLKKLGHGIMDGPNVYEDSGTGISNTPELCAKELTDMYVSDKNDILISCGGGELMCETLEWVDFEAIGKSEPKWFLGYSDNTNFTFLNTIINDVATIYGPCAGAFGMQEWHRAVNDVYSVINGECRNDTFVFSGYDGWEKESLKSEENPYASYNITEKSEPMCYIGNRRSAKAEKIFFSGRLLGGCMDCLVNITGTKYDVVDKFVEKYKDDGIIWFLESCDLNVFAIRRAMWQMENAGWFKYTKGFIIGRPLVHGQEYMGLDQYKAVLGIIGKYDVPVVMDADIGHLAPAMPVITGSLGNVSFTDGKYQLSMKLV